MYLGSSPNSGSLFGVLLKGRRTSLGRAEKRDPDSENYPLGVRGGEAQGQFGEITKSLSLSYVSYALSDMYIGSLYHQR